MFPRKRIFALMLVGALLGTSALAPAQASAAHGRVVGPVPLQPAAVSERKRTRRRRVRVRTIVLRIGVRVRGARMVRPDRKAFRSQRRLLDTVARGPPRPQK
jgi:hypothetical protein